VRVKKAEGEAPFGWDTLAQVVLPIANAALGFVGYYAMAENAGTDWVEPWLAVGFAGFYLLLLRLPARGKLKASPALLSALASVRGRGFLNDRDSVEVAWSLADDWMAYGRSGAAVGCPSGAVAIAARAALICLALGLMALLVVNPDAIATPVFNERFGTYCVGIAVFAFAAWLAARARPEADHSEADQNQTINGPDWRGSRSRW